MRPRTFLMAGLALSLTGCAGGGPFITPPIGSLGYTVLGTTYLGASMSQRAGSGNNRMIKIIPTFNAIAFVTVWIPPSVTVGTYQTGNNANGTCYVQLEDTTESDPDLGVYGSTALSGTITVTAMNPPVNGQRGHITGTFSSQVQNAYGDRIIVQNGTFDGDYDP